MKKNIFKNFNVQGLYDKKNEHDACGLGFIANIKGIKSHKIVSDGIKILENLEHRGATGADPLVGDGAGMLVQIPHEFFVKECKTINIDLPEEGNYSVGYFFIPKNKIFKEKIKKIITNTFNSYKHDFICWRNVPTDNSKLSKDPEILAAEPFHLQGFFHLSLLDL